MVCRKHVVADILNLAARSDGESHSAAASPGLHHLEGACRALVGDMESAHFDALFSAYASRYSVNSKFSDSPPDIGGAESEAVNRGGGAYVVGDGGGGKENVGGGGHALQNVGDSNRPGCSVFSPTGCLTVLRKLEAITCNS